MQIRWYRARVLRVTVGILAAGMLLMGCTRGGRTPQIPPTEVAELETDSQVRREMAVVWAGPGDVSVLPGLDDQDWHSLPAGSLVTTDDSGEGWVNISDCMLIYIFQNSGLAKAACPKSDYIGGNVTCAIEGTSVYNNSCAGQVIIQTLSAEVELQGTWLSVTYLPDQQLSLIMVFEGDATVRPVLDFDARTLGGRRNVEEGHFWFSTPGDRADRVAGLDARESHPFDRLPPLLDALDLWPWMDRIQARADTDDVPFPELPVVALGHVVLQGGGGSLENESVQEAILHIVPWEALTEEAFPGQDVAVAVELPDWEIDARKITYDPDVAHELMPRFFAPVELLLLFPPDDEPLAGITEVIADSLGQLGIEVKRDAVPATEAQGMMRDIVLDGSAVLWLGREFLDVDLTLPTPVASFRADPNTLYSYQDPGCTTLRWEVQNASAVSLNGQLMPESGETEDCPGETTTYTLRVEHLNGDITEYGETVTVIQDETPPAISRPDVSPAEPQAGDRVAITVAARDAESGLDRIEISANRKLVQRCASARCSVTLGPFTGAGTVQYEVRAYDRAGNQASHADSFTVSAVSAGQPDLVVTGLETTGTATVSEDGNIEVPVRVVVRNQGSAEAGVFKVATEYTGPQGTFAAAFTVPGQGDIWYPHTNAPLAPGSSVTFAGRVTFLASARGTTISLRAIADSCSGDEFMPEYCRIEESREDNNDSQSITVSLGGGVVLRGGGGALKDSRVQTAVLHAAPWADMVAKVFGDPNLPVLTELDGQEVDARKMEHNPDLALQMLAEAGYPDGFGVTLLVPQGDDQLVAMGDWLVSSLGGVRIDAGFNEVPADDARDIMAKYLAAGKPVLWLSRQ